MELDRALELAVVASWEDLVKPSDTSSVHVEYEKQPNSPLTSLSVWTIKHRGYATLVCRYSVAPSNSPTLSSEVPGVHFANAYHSKKLVKDLDFIMRNQGQFTRPVDRSVHGLVQIDCPSAEERGEASAWSRSIPAEFAKTVWN